MQSIYFVFALPFTLFIRFPFLAMIPAISFGAIYLRSGKKTLGVISGIWLLYCVWEALLHWRILCTGECNIRIDLLFLAPILWIATLAGFWVMAKKRR